MSVLAALLLAAATWLALAPSPEPRLTDLLGGAATIPRSRPQLSTLAWVAGGSAAVGCVALVPGMAGVFLGLIALAGVPASVRRLETSGERREREDLARQGPVVCDLLSATLASGAPLAVGIGAVAHALPPPASLVLASVSTSMHLGATAEVAWQPWVQDPVVGPIAAAVTRSARTGAPLAAMLARLADDLRRERRTVVEVAARSAGVRAVLPLAACFLPAFLFLGVVPVVASLAAALIS